MLEATEKFVESDLLILKALEKNLGGLQKKLLKICKSKLLLSGILARGSKVRICYLKKRVKFRKVISSPYLSLHRRNIVHLLVSFWLD